VTIAVAVELALVLTASIINTSAIICSQVVRISPYTIYLSKFKPRRQIRDVFILVKIYLKYYGIMDLQQSCIMN
jgi:hypothetical protein